MDTLTGISSQIREKPGLQGFFVNMLASRYQALPDDVRVNAPR
jgi:hypothetical protein